MVYGLSRQALRQRQAEIIEMAGLEGRENALTNTLSGGWKQRLALGCAIVHRPQVIVRSIEWIAPSLEDVFISSVNAPGV